jgi:hypothetical protein
MTMYRVTATLSQRQLIDYLDANGAVEVKIEVVGDQPAPTAASTAPGFTPRALKRRRRTRAEIEHDRAQATQASAAA